MLLTKIAKLKNTLAFRLTLWYAAIFTLSSCVAFFLFYLLITSYMRQQTDRELIDQVKRISSVLSVQGMNALERIAILEAQAAGEKKIFIRLLAPNGSVFSSSNMSSWKNIEIEQRAVRRLLEGSRYVFDTVRIADRRHDVRIVYSVVSGGLMVQLGQSLENAGRFIEAFQKILIVTILLLILFAALVGWFMARRALAKITLVTRTARDISGGSLDKRVPVTQAGDEVDQLAATFNQMLDRIEALIAGIREMNDNIAHDLKSPLTRIRGIAEITLTADPSLDAFEKMSAGVIEECDRLLDMINTMLVISKTEAGVERLDLDELDIGVIVKDACLLFQASAEDKKIVLACHVNGPVPVKGDMRMLQRMVANLIDNAIKYTPEKGVVDVSVGAGDGHRAVITITDTGMGISDTDLPHIFKRFYRCDPSRTTAGTGLGLSLGLAVAAAHGGAITVSSKPGKGSTFTVRLPLNKPRIQT